MTCVIRDVETKTYRALTEDDIPDGLINLDQPYAIVRTDNAALRADVAEIVANAGEDSDDYDIDGFVSEYREWWDGTDEDGVEHISRQGVFLIPMDDDDFWERMADHRIERTAVTPSQAIS